MAQAPSSCCIAWDLAPTGGRNHPPSSAAVPLATAPPCASLRWARTSPDDPERTVAEARQSAIVTHAHPEGQAGAIAVAVAAALAAQPSGPEGEAFIDAVMQLVPTSEVRSGLRTAVRFRTIAGTKR